MIPQEKSAAVTRGLREAFEVTAFEEISQITKGHTSSLVFRIVVRGTPYLLKIITRPDNPTRHYTCMKAAAEAGLAPHVWYTNIEDQVSITGFVEAVPFPVTEALVRIPAALCTLHALPPFPPALPHLNTTCMFLTNKAPAVDGFIQRFQAANLLPKAEGEELFARYTQLAAIYPHDDADMVSSHNDLFKPDNILFDNHRVWLVDWEAAFLNDRYADLAVAANLVVTNESDEQAYLEAYFGGPPDDYQRARFLLAQQIAHVFYAMAFLLIGSAGKPVDHSERMPDFREFHRCIWDGEADLADNYTRTVYARVHLRKLLQDTQRFSEAVRTVADYGRRESKFANSR